MPPYRDPKCVHVANSFAEAGVVQSWLAAQDIEVRVMDEATLGGLEGLTWMMPAVSTRGLEVWANDEETAERARALLAVQSAEIKSRQAALKQRTGDIHMTCPECGNPCVFPASRAGRTEHCPHCRKYLDVPDPDAGPDDEFWRTVEGEADTP